MFEINFNFNLIFELQTHIQLYCKSLFPCLPVQESAATACVTRSTVLMVASALRVVLTATSACVRSGSREVSVKRVSQLCLSSSALRVHFGCWQRQKNSYFSHLSGGPFAFPVLSPSVQVSCCPHLSSMRRCIRTPSSPGLSLLRAICPLWSLR